MNIANIGAPASVAVVIVTYNSKNVIGMCLDALAAQTRLPDLTIILDNNATDPAYLADLPSLDNLKVIRNASNQGFCAANNTGYTIAHDNTYVLFLNPDAFPQNDLIERSVQWMERPENADVGVVTGTLLGYDIAHRRATGAIDSTGIFQRWYGKWYDRGQGSAWIAKADGSAAEEVPAACGALMFCRYRALESSLLPSGDVFDSRFFMYKEDIDLSLRLRRLRWRVVYIPTLLCFHCRGWQSRSRMSRLARYLSARNEIRVCLRNRGRGLVYSALKMMFVQLQNAWIELSHRIGRVWNRKTYKSMK